MRVADGKFCVTKVCGEAAQAAQLLEGLQQEADALRARVRTANARQFEHHQVFWSLYPFVPSYMLSTSTDRLSHPQTALLTLPSLFCASCDASLHAV